MTLISPFYAIIFPFLLFFTLPIAIFASVTSLLALSVLAFRVILIYIELLVAVIPYYLLGAKPPSKPLPRTKSFTDPVVRVRRRKRRSSSSNVSAGTITPVSGEGYGLSQSIGPTRDFEGVGGWRLDNNPSDDDGLWTNINSRLELPADHVRRHHRSLTSGSIPLRGRNHRSSSPEVAMTSPNTSRARTPPTTMTSAGGYFSQQPLSPRTVRKSSSVMTSASGSSESSKGSSGLSMKRL